jgi:uncharacterized protein
MAHPNVELFRTKVVEPLLAGDVVGIRAAHTDDVVYRIESCGKLTGSFRGIDEVMTVLAGLADPTDGTFRIEPFNILADNDDHVVMLSSVTAQRGDQTLNTREIDVFHMTGGKIDDVWFALEDGVAQDRFWSQAPPEPISRPGVACGSSAGIGRTET